MTKFITRRTAVFAATTLVLGLASLTTNSAFAQAWPTK